MAEAEAGRSRLPRARAGPASFAEIWSNPPVRIGKPALHELLRRWLLRLAPGAGATLVMGRNLGADSLHAWLEKDEGWSVTRLSARSGYRLLVVTAPDDSERMVATVDGR